MLDNAFKYEEEVRMKLLDTWYDDKYKFYHASSYHEVYSLSAEREGDWDSRRFVSVDSRGDIIGLIHYWIAQHSEKVSGLGAINFSDNRITFGVDLMKVVDEIFCKYNFRKIEFCVIIGNPIEASYDRMVERYGGCITGIRHKSCKLIDNQYYDEKTYEIFREDYIDAKQRRKKDQ